MRINDARVWLAVVALLFHEVFNVYYMVSVTAPASLLAYLAIAFYFCYRNEEPSGSNA
jgi:hypothetical protein